MASGCVGMNLHLSELLSQVLEPVANAWTGGMEVISTDDELNKIDSLNERNRQAKELRQADSDNSGSLADMVHTDDERGESDSVDSDRTEVEGRSDPPYTDSSSDRAEPEQLSGANHDSDKEEGMNNKERRMNRGRRMREMRKNLADSRKRKQYRNLAGDDEWLEELDRLTSSKEVASDMVQDRSKPMVIIGADVDALYPSLEADEVAAVCYQSVMDSEVSYEGVDYLEAVRYLALNMTEQECRLSPLRRVIPYRRGKTGTRPGITGSGPMGPTRGDTEQWVFRRVTLTENEKRMIIALVIRISVKVMFRSHIYTFGGKLYLQKNGGPIGLRGTCAIARVAMSDWDKRWLRRLEEWRIILEEDSRYMDDIRVFMYPLRPGWRFRDGELLHCKRWELEDVNDDKSDIKLSRDVLEGTMEGLQHFLKFTMETGEDFQHGRLPTLDTSLWVDQQNVVHYTFYEKPMCLNQVLQKDTALPENCKMSSLSNEMIRRMKNTSELLPMEERIIVVCLKQGR